jgi:hypothetical protein
MLADWTDSLANPPALQWSLRSPKNGPSSHRCSVPHLGEGFEGGFVGVGEGVEVLLGGAEAAVAEALLDDLEVGAAREEPGGVGVAEVVDAHVDHQVRLLQRWPPDRLAEPARRDMPIRVTRSQSARVVLAVGAALGPVAAVGVPAVVAAAAPE